MKKVGIAIIIFVFLIIALSFGKNAIAKAALLKWVNTATGLEMTVKSVNIGIIRTLIDIKGLRLSNPYGVPDRLMADMPEIYVDYNLRAFTKGKVHLEEVRLNLKELIVVRDRENRVNLDSLAMVQTIKEGINSRQERANARQRSKKPSFRIDLLKLKVGKVLYKDYSQGPQPIIQEYNIDIEEEYENITNPYVFLSLIIARSLAKTPFEVLADFDIDSLKKEAPKMLNNAKDAAQKAVERTRRRIKEILPLGK